MSTWCLKHIEAWNKLIVKFCASSWLITTINILRCMVSKTSKLYQFKWHQLTNLPLYCCSLITIFWTDVRYLSVWQFCLQLFKKWFHRRGLLSASQLRCQLTQAWTVIWENHRESSFTLCLQEFLLQLDHLEKMKCIHFNVNGYTYIGQYQGPYTKSLQSRST